MPTYEKSGAGDDSLVRVLTGYSTETKKKILKKVQTRGKKFKIGEFEVVGVTDVVTDVYISEPDLQINVYEEQAVTENVETAQASFIDVYEEQAVTEDVETAKTSFVDVFDSTTPSDVVVDLIITEDYDISVYDEAGVTEYVETGQGSFINVFDQQAVTEQVFTAQESFIDVFDSPGVTDVVDDLIVTEDYDINVYDEAGVTDVVDDIDIPGPALLINEFDSTGVTENIETAQASFIDVFDSQAVTDVVDGILRVYTVDVSDSTTPVEDVEIDPLILPGIEIDDTTGVTDVVTDIEVVTPFVDTLFVDVYDETTVTDVVTDFEIVWVLIDCWGPSPQARTDIQFTFGRNARSDLNNLYTTGIGDYEEVRIIVEAHSTQDTAMRGAAIGRKAATDPDYLSGEWIRFLFSASETTTVPAGTWLASDWMLFPIRGSRDYWLHHRWLADDYATNSGYLNCERKITDVDETEIEDVSDYILSGFGSQIIARVELRNRTHIIDEFETTGVTDVVTDVQFTQPDITINIQEPVITLIEDITVDPLIIPGIDVYDEPSVTDFVEMGQGSFIDVYDEPTVTDVVVGILKVFTIDEFDSTGVTDEVEMGQGSFIDVYDEATPVENIDIDPFILAGIDVFDTTGVTDEETVTIPAEPHPEINVYDQTTPVEDITVDPLIIPGIDVYDEVAVTEQVETAQVSFIDVWDATTPTDVVVDLVVSEDYDISVYDEAGVTESVETAQESFIDVYDQPSATDVVVGILKVFTISEFDTTGVTESIETAQESFIDVWDSPGVTDVVEGISVVYDDCEINVFDATTPSDVIVGVTIPEADLQISEFDQTTVQESVTTAQGSFVDVWDTAGVTDVVVGIDALTDPYEIDVYDQAGVTEDVAIDPLVIPGIDVFDSVAVTESLETSLSSPSCSVFDSVAVTEDITVLFSLAISESETVGVTELVAARASDLLIDVNDSVAVTDAAQALIPVDLDISVFDAVAVTDVVVSLSIVFAADISALGPWFKARTTSVTFKPRECNITFSTVKKAA